VFVHFTTTPTSSLPGREVEEIIFSVSEVPTLEEVLLPSLGPRNGKNEIKWSRLEEKGHL